MGVKYVRDFEFPASAGFRDSAMPAKARASERGMPAAAKKGVAKLARGGQPAPGSKAVLGRAKYAKGGKVSKYASGGPTTGGPQTRVPTGPTAPQYGYIPNPFGRDFRFQKGLTKAGFPNKPTTNPYDIFGNPNPHFNRALAEYEEELRQQQPRERARGGMIAKRANGGMMSKGPATRGTPAKGRAQGRMDFAEKYAPGLSIDMPGKRVKKK